jgi:hypothetical protein
MKGPKHGQSTILQLTSRLATFADDRAEEDAAAAAPEDAPPASAPTTSSNGGGLFTVDE